jgi:hypothetical protein
VVAVRGGRRPAGREDDPRSGTIGMVGRVVANSEVAPASVLPVPCYPALEWKEKLWISWTWCKRSVDQFSLFDRKLQYFVNSYS